MTKAKAARLPCQTTKQVSDVAIERLTQLRTAFGVEDKFLLAAGVAAFAALPTAEQFDLLNKVRIAHADAVKASCRADGGCIDGGSEPTDPVASAA